MGDFINRLKGLSNKQLIIYLGCAVAVVVLVLVIVVTACQPREEQAGPVEESTSSESESESEAEPVIEIKSQVENIEDAFNQNADVVGWLYIPGLDINEPVVQKAGNNKYPYNNTDWLGKSIGDYTNYPASCYYTHYSNTFGKAAELSANTVIFGHSSRGYRQPTPYVGDEPTDGKFSQLFNFKDDEFAKKTPYIFFSTADEDMVWEVFAVSYSDDGIWYIQQDDKSAKTMEETISKMRANSLYDYDVKVTGEDKILTLSTCTAAAGPMQADWVYRFVVMAKLVDKKDATKTEAAFKVNDDIKYPDGFKFFDYTEKRAAHDLGPLENPIQTGNYAKEYLKAFPQFAEGAESDSSSSGSSSSGSSSSGSSSASSSN